MTAFMIATTTINSENPHSLQVYVEGTLPLIEAAGGRLVSRYGHKETVFGSAGSEFVVIVEYPSGEAIRKLFQSTAYKQLIPARDKAFSAYDVSIYEVLYP